MSGVFLFFALWATFFLGPSYCAFHDSYESDRSRPSTKTTTAFLVWVVLFIATITLAYYAGRFAQ